MARVPREIEAEAGMPVKGLLPAPWPLHPIKNKTTKAELRRVIIQRRGKPRMKGRIQR